jgi:hypothetical protein
MTKTFKKDPDATLDYTWDWTRWLKADETITSQTVIVPSGITLISSGAEDGFVTAWLSGGVNGQTYTVTCRIETDQAREDDRSIRLWVIDR